MSQTVQIQVEISTKGQNRMINLDQLPLGTTIGQVKDKLQVRPNSRFGRVGQFENWDNRRTLADYFVKDGEHFVCVVQSMMQEGQPAYDDYDEWLRNNQQ